MAITNTIDAFNPATPDVQPGDYSRSFRPVDAYRKASATGEALKGAGTMLTLGVTAADNAVKESIKEDATSAADAEREEFTSALQGATRYAAEMRNPNAPVDASATPGSYDVPKPASLVDTPEAPLPPELKNLPDKLGVLSSARGAGKITETDYYGRLATIAKDVRSRYPVGYRDYVDAQIQKVTGVDPANAYIRGMVADINASMTNADKEHNAMLGELRNNMQYPGVKEAYQLLFARKINASQAAEFLAGPKLEEQKLRLANLQYTNIEAGNKNKQQAAETLVDQTLGSEIKNSLHVLTLDPQVKDPDQLQKFARDMATGVIPSDPQKAEIFARYMDANIGTATRNINLALDKVREDGTTLRGTMDPVKLQAKVDAALAPMVKIRQSLSQGKTDIASYDLNMAIAAQSQTRLALFNDPGVFGNYLKLSDTLNHFGGQGASAALLTSSISKGVSNEVARRLDITKLGLATPAVPGVTKDATSLKGAIDWWSKLADSKGVANPAIQQNLTEMIDGRNGLSLLDPKSSPETRKAIAYSIFNPDNIGILRGIVPDRYDSKGRVVPGAETLYYRATAPDVVAAIKNQNDPVLNGWYKDWVQTEVQQGVFRSNFSKLDTLPLEVSGQYKVEWSSKDHVVKFTSLATNDSYNRSGINAANANPELIVAGVNKGILGLKNYAIGTGMSGDEVDAFIIDNLMRGGLPIGQAAKIKGLPEKISSSIKAAYAEVLEKDKQAQELRSQKIQDRYTGPAK
jgi:hypothetical protein